MTQPQELRLDPNAHTISALAREIVAQHQGAGIITMAQAVTQAREELAHADARSPK